MPKAHTGEDAHNAYLKAKKDNPGLTPAAWRKAAAQEMGLDYNTYLTLWKAGKAAKSKVKMTSPGAPTKPTVAGPGAEMGAVKKVPAKKTATPAVDEGVVWKGDEVWVNGKKFGEVKKTTSSSWEMTGQGKLGVKVKDAAPWKPNIASQFTQHPGFKTKKAAKNFLQKKADDANLAKTATVKAEQTIIKATDDVIEEAAEGPMTALGVKLDHDIAKDIYTQMKKQFPGQTPAYWRKAAAEYLEVDYKDYLLAWKNKAVGPKVKKAALPKDKPGETPPLAPSAEGKYAGKPINDDQMIDELAKAYGPGANKQYINLDIPDYDTGYYTVPFPSSILQSPAAVERVVEHLKKLGFDVKKVPGSKQTFRIKPSGWTPTKHTGKNYATVVRNGKTVMEERSGNAWAGRWWAKQSQATKSAWHKYTGPSYRDINTYWRTGNAGWMGATEIRALSKRISDSMLKIEDEITIFRGTGQSLSHFKEGRLWSDDAYLSTSIDAGAKFSSSVSLEIVCPKGTKGMFIGPKSSHPGEKEFLLDRGTKFRVLSVQGNHVKLVVIP